LFCLRVFTSRVCSAFVLCSQVNSGVWTVAICKNFALSHVARETKALKRIGACAVIASLMLDQLLSFAVA
jgi:hypothetical protein